MAEQRGDRFVEVEERYAGYEVYDRDGDKVGKVDDLFVDENDNPEYVVVRMGLFGLSGTPLNPWEKVRAEEGGQRLEVMADKATVKDAPSFNDDEEITPEYERQVYEHYGLQRTEGTAERGGYGAYYRDEDSSAYPEGERTAAAGPGMTMGDREAGG